MKILLTICGISLLLCAFTCHQKGENHLEISEVKNVSAQSTK